MSEEIPEVAEVIQTTEDILKDYTRDQLAQIVLSWIRHKEILQAGQKKYKQKPEVIERMKIKNAELYMKKNGITEEIRQMRLDKKALSKAEKFALILKDNMPDDSEAIAKAFKAVEDIKTRIASYTPSAEV
jgi:hypothetical protein